MFPDYQRFGSQAEPLALLCRRDDHGQTLAQWLADQS